MRGDERRGGGTRGERASRQGEHQTGHPARWDEQRSGEAPTPASPRRLQTSRRMRRARRPRSAPPPERGAPSGPLQTAFRDSLPFTPDRFQDEALAALERGHSVLVTAPTGAGKTLIADFAAYMAVAQGRGLIYTTPIKALSNQKYRQLRTQFGAERVGLVTGDTVINREAPLLVMTTEIVRNLLVMDPAGLGSVGYVVFDEVHFLADAERGPVWEEAIIWAPPEVQLICLSATVSNADEITRWLETVHGRTTLISHDERPVPLEDYLYQKGDLTLARDAAGRVVLSEAPPPRRERRLHGRRQGTIGGDLWEDQDEQDERAEGWAARERPWERRRNSPAPDPALPATVVETLRRHKLLPTIYFRFSRAGVEECAALLARSAVTAGSAAAEVVERRAVATARTLGDLDADARALPHTRMLEEYIARGVAFHHAGLIHPLKTLVEELFAVGAIDVVFATGTLSMGLHLPAKSVVLADLKKFNGSSVEWLTATEYRQLTGRAGRRGIDTRGAAVFIVGLDQRFAPIARRLFGQPEALRSAFALRYNTFLNVYAPGADERILLLLENSLSRYQDIQVQLLGRGDQWDGAIEGGRGRRGRVRRARPDGGRNREEALRASLARLDRRLVRSMRRILEQEGCLDARGHLLLRGALAARIFNSWGIAFATLLLDGSLAALTPPELAEVGSWFISSKFGEATSGRGRWREGVRSPYAAGLSPHLSALADAMTTNVTRLRHHELSLEVELTPPWELPNHRFVRTWCEKGLLAPILEQTGAPPGDVLQVLGQTLDLLRQGQRALGELMGAADPSARLLEQAIAAISGNGKLLHLLGL